MDKFSFLNAAHTAYFAQLYDEYLINPDKIEPSWRAFFQGFDFGMESATDGDVVVEYIERGESKSTQVPDQMMKEFSVVKLIDAYRSRGHLFTKTNPVRERRNYEPKLGLENFGLTNADLDTLFDSGELIGLGKASLKSIIDHLEQVYCDSIGVEYMYIRKPHEIKWIQSWLHRNNNHPSFSKEQKTQILKKLNEAVSFESFLHTKYVGQKRFSLEGNESLIPALDALIENAADKGVDQFILGMAHRGRLNVLTNIFGKPVKDIFSEFDGKDYEQDIFDGDVKYHLGYTSKRKTDNGNDINLNIVPNPSHLETVGAVVEGIARAKQDMHNPENFSKVLPIVLHGDAAIAGQGIVYEVVQMSQLDAYKTAGTIHLVVNNQVGFTTNYLDARSSTYCTDVAKVTLSPVLHVNADDAEAVVHAMNFALDYRMEFGRDVFIDLLGYRKYGHNEGDEPRFTQPQLYKAIGKHKNPRDIYADKLLQEGLIDNSKVKELEAQYKERLEEELATSRQMENTIITPFMQDEWNGFEQATEVEMMQQVETGVDRDTLEKITATISQLPEGESFIRKIKKIIESRQKMWDEDKLDWAMGEHLAYGSLMMEGYNVRMSGQDVERGTFSHRHAVVKSENHENEFILHNHIDGVKGKMDIYNSHLSEYGVVGFEYGYALARPNTLTIWEAQFGDFSNGAQIMMDQYISAGEDKWKNQNGLVKLLPHGYEGQGAEHSSARIERYLQLCARDNMFMANCTTPANMFHLLRRQMLVNYRKPLVVFTPKSLLRYPKAVSTISEFENGHFQEVIDVDGDAFAKAKTLVFTSGKFYYDLLEYREENKRTDVALVRLEQLFPLPVEQMQEIIKKYGSKDIVWAQEEPRNMGAYSHLMLHMPETRSWRVCSRNMYAAPASGSSTRSKRRQARIIEDVFNTNK
ncbi:2-oxoglutarate dehydrogenase E1 component [Nonlabens dokdonensis]|uniref:oxoglutarate dehydrogenase (succinyl-transferring) n=2 Tax=Nonlabens dokdonensis TaxID=328515 RepID=L7W9F5_NONDD|nr:2-oxoglutarate dehydrogenase E1 component [Nonlabens dokdonensis]AGC76842.1 2-oxoglutarate dehydrogenase, dehydrogenase (E1) component [Nonlabens dokdonensis DSW-6]PZX44483.1 2-oxoglutarate dehydrogenase E1 component [Nonlabens dokdonensis]